MIHSHKSGFGASAVIFYTLFTFAAIACAGTYSGGTGTVEDPYRIGTADDLIALGQTPADYDQCFILMADIDLGTYSFTKAVIAPNTVRSENVFHGRVFTGGFNGNGKTLLNLTITALGSDFEYLGLFGKLDGATILNLRLKGVTITTDRFTYCLGCLAGESVKGTIINCSSTGQINTGESVYVGGLIGNHSQGNLSRCFSKVNISTQFGPAYIGGLIGNNKEGTLLNCYATGTISGGPYANHMGGLLGANDFGMVLNCYSTGPITVGTDASYIAGLVGLDDGSVCNCFWDMESSGISTDPSGLGKTTAQMKERATFRFWGGYDAWTLDDGNDYPRLAWEEKPGIVIPHDGYSAGSGLPNDPYWITTELEFRRFCRTPIDWDKSFVLMTDLELGEIHPADLVGEFTGVFDGGGHTINGLTIKAPSNYLGLFRKLSNGGIVRNLILTGVSITGTDNSRGCYYYGALVGNNFEGNIYNCIVDVDIAGSRYGYSIGGLTGNNYRGAIEQCGVVCSIVADNMGYDRVGGLCGHNFEGTITGSFAMGGMTVDGSAGGLVGFNESGMINACQTDIEVWSGTDCDGAGGLVGFNNRGTILDCSSSGYVGAGSFAGGLVATDYSGTISNCRSTAVVESYSSCGGLIATTDSGLIMNCYASGAVTNYNEYVDYNSAAGLVDECIGGRITNCYAIGRVRRLTSYPGPSDGYGLVGENRGIVSNSFWDIESSGTSVSMAGQGKTTAEMKNLGTFRYWGGFDTWTLEDGNDYPRLRWEQAEGMLIPYLGYVQGSGGPEDPYRITSADEFRRIGLTAYDWDKSFVLETDILLGDMNVEQLCGWFTGCLDGGGHTIAGLTVQSGASYLGLFRSLDIGAEVKNLKMADCAITGTDLSSNIGTLAGRAIGVYISNCSVSASVAGPKDIVGGLVGNLIDCTVTDSDSDGTVSGKGTIGGLIGTVSGVNSSITGCFSSSAVVGSGNQLGGLLGYLQEGTIERCYANGTVHAIASSDVMGGLVGRIQDGAIMESYATTGLSCRIVGRKMGGLIGFNLDSFVTNCYARCPISTSNGSQIIGGLIGHNQRGMIIDCYSTGPISAPNSVALGGLIGYGDGMVCMSFWDLETTGQTKSVGGKGKTTAQMKQADTFKDWGGQEIWAVGEPNQYPTLVWQQTPSPAIPYTCGYSKGAGTPNDPYQIHTAEEFINLGKTQADWDKCFALVNDLDLDQFDPEQLCGRFTGVFDGRGHTIRGFKVESEQYYLGLVRILGEQGVISNLTLDNVAITGGIYSNYIGGLAGYADHADIRDCRVNGTLNAGKYGSCLGGLVGVNEGGDLSRNKTIVNIACPGTSLGGLAGSNSGGTIQDCVATVTITGSRGVGGLAGGNSGGVIRSCHVTGTMTGSENLGGLVGGNAAGAIITDCYSNVEVSGFYLRVGALVGNNSDSVIKNCFMGGSVLGGTYPGTLIGENVNANIVDCFWNSDQPETNIDIGRMSGTGILVTSGKSSSDLRNITTYLTANWDFTSESANGTADLWRMCTDGVDYPRLAWEFADGGDFMCPSGVAMEDLVYLAGRWMASAPETVGAADGSGDGKVDLSDFGILADNWMRE